jgi:hypothetical protein
MLVTLAVFFVAVFVLHSIFGEKKYTIEAIPEIPPKETEQIV